MVLMACSSDDDEAENTASSNPDLTSYFETLGDKLSHANHIEATYSDGQELILDSVSTENYGEVSSIPAKYSYSGDIPGPYALNVLTQDCVIDGFSYDSSQDEEIIEDDLETYKTIDAQTKTGDSEPADFANISVGDVFTFTEDSILFDSATGQEVGNEVSSSTLVVISFEEITVPAGTYDAVIFDLAISSSATKGNITDTATTTGLVWYEVNKKFPIKLVATLHVTINEFGLTADATSERVLTAYNPAVNNRAQIVSAKSTSYELTHYSLLNSIKQTLLDIREK
jgi:hypothetical protein